ncbi:hypothetical protein SUGI_0171590 [Cryptomeria japonica]|uniref:transcription repressor MYB6 n=1 Tax=Cryptomeria japonica TaxID=3369 RepID=UPI002408D2DA|nr:transcription repressor MYB6 [Cryptomeria japonica]GLJ11571.1 hypothetical protein SUGI_0171590 [Cryptomeria japonica]
MGRRPGSSQPEDFNRGAWTAQEDKILADYIRTHGEIGWRALPKKAGLNRCGKSCRLRWLNYLRPDIKRGNISPDEEELIIRMHRLLGNRWALIAGRLPGRTDNEIKNYWNTHLSKKLSMSNNKSIISKTHLPVQESTSFEATEKYSLPSLNSSEDDGDKASELRSSSDESMSFGEGEALNVSKSWAQLLEDSLMADLEDESSIPSPNLSVSCPLEYTSPISLPCIDFGAVEDFSVESLLQPEAYGLEDLCPLQDNASDDVNHADCLAVSSEPGISEIYDTLQSEQGGQMELASLDQLFYYEENWKDSVDLISFGKTAEEEYLNILADIPI